MLKLFRDKKLGLINNLFFNSSDLGFERICPLDPRSQNVVDPRSPKHCINIVFFFGLKINLNIERFWFRRILRSRVQSSCCPDLQEQIYSLKRLNWSEYCTELCRIAWNCSELCRIAWNCTELCRIAWNYAELRASKVYLRWKPYSVLP